MLRHLGHSHGGNQPADSIGATSRDGSYVHRHPVLGPRPDGLRHRPRRGEPGQVNLPAQFPEVTLRPLPVDDSEPDAAQPKKQT
jgi:hypothetical protein